MIDVEQLLIEAKGETAVKCRTCIWLATRPEEEREKWEEAIESRRHTIPQIERAMAAVPSETPPPKMHGILHHRTGKHAERT